MQQALLGFLVLTLSVSLSQSVTHSCSDTNATTKIDRHDEETLNLLKNQVESLSARLDRHDQLADTHNTIRRRVELLRSSNENNQIEIKVLGARLNEHNELIGSTTRQYPSNCAEIASKGQANGIFTIQIDLVDKQPFEVSCNDSYDGGWTVIQRRQDGSVDFYRKWSEYKKGFGNLEVEFFIGLDKLHALTAESPQELLIVMRDFEGETRTAKYDAFAIGDESEDYAMKILGKYSGNAGDALRIHAAQKFSTKDRDNDKSYINCAYFFKGGWWYNACFDSNLNGMYFRGRYQRSSYGVGWKLWHELDYSLKYVQMMIRPKRN